MGSVVKYIMGGNRPHPKYEDWIIEQNADGKVHIHIKNIRLDLTIKAYNQFYDIISDVNEKMKSNE